MEAAAGSPSDPIKIDREGRKEEETDGEEFIKVEKESLEDDSRVSPTPPLTYNLSPKDDSQSAMDESLNNLGGDLMEVQQKMNELEHKLEMLTTTLMHSEYQNASMKDEMLVVQQKLEESHQKYSELDSLHKKLQWQIVEEEKNFASRINSLQDELKESQEKQKEFFQMKGSYDALNLELGSSKTRIAEMICVAEKLSNSEEELLRVKQELSQTKLQLEEMDQRFSSREAVVITLSQELELKKSLENLLTLANDELRSKTSELEKIKLNLQEETKQKASVHDHARAQEEQISIFKEELEKLMREKEIDMEAMKENRCVLEDQLKLSENNFHETDSLLAEALSKNAELEEKMKSMAELHKESAAAALSSTEQFDVLEKLLHESNKAAETAELQLKKMESSFKEKIHELSDLLNRVEERNQQLTCQMIEQEEKVTKLETSERQLLSQNSELEQNLNIAMVKWNEQDNQATLMKMEALHEASKSRIQELEDLTAILEAKLAEAESSLMSKTNKVSELSPLLEEFQTRVLSLNLELESFVEKEKTLRVHLDSETNQKMKLEDELKNTSEKLVQAKDEGKVLTNEIHGLNENMATLTASNEELQRQILETDQKVGGFVLENEILVKANDELKRRMDELQELFNATVYEKEAAVQQLSSSMDAVAEATGKQGRAEELHSAAELQLVLIQARVEEANQILTQRESELTYLLDKINSHESQMKLYEEQANKASGIAESSQAELEEALRQLKQQELMIKELESTSRQIEKENGDLCLANLNLTQQLAMNESKLSDFDASMNPILANKVAEIELLQSSMAAIEDEVKKLTQTEQELRSQIDSLMEENNFLNESGKTSATKLQSRIAELEGDNEESKTQKSKLESEIENLRKEVSEQSQTHSRMIQVVERFEVNILTESKSKLEEKQPEVIPGSNILKDQVEKFKNEFKLAQNTIVEQKKEISKNKPGREPAMKKEIAHLEKQILELQHKLQLSDAKLLEKAGNVSKPEEEKDGLEKKKTLDNGLPISTTPHKRRIKKKSEAVPSSLESDVHATNLTHHTTFRFVSVVALISVVIGIIVGKSY